MGTVCSQEAHQQALPRTAGQKSTQLGNHCKEAAQEALRQLTTCTCRGPCHQQTGKWYHASPVGRTGHNTWAEETAGRLTTCACGGPCHRHRGRWCGSSRQAAEHHRLPGWCASGSPGPPCSRAHTPAHGRATWSAQSMACLSVSAAEAQLKRTVKMAQSAGAVVEVKARWVSSRMPVAQYSVSHWA